MESFSVEVVLIFSFFSFVLKLHVSEARSVVPCQLFISLLELVVMMVMLVMVTVTIIISTSTASIRSDHRDLGSPSLLEEVACLTLQDVIVVIT